MDDYYHFLGCGRSLWMLEHDIRGVLLLEATR
jgi:hypothetical protein